MKEIGKKPKLNLDVSKKDEKKSQINEPLILKPKAGSKIGKGSGAVKDIGPVAQKSSRDWNGKNNKEEAKRLDDVRNDKKSFDTRSIVKDQLLDIKGINQDMEEKQSTGGLTCCFKDRTVKN